MNSTIHRVSFACLVLAIATPLMAHNFKAGSLTISHPWARETAKGQVVGGGFMKITNNGKADDRLVSATSNASAEVQVHTMSMNNGVMQMRQLKDGIAIPAGQTVELKPGSLHVMFMGLKKPLVRGTKLPVTLRFARAGAVKVQFAIQPVGSTGP
ncbi:MAG: copper chaperone PCu(A)C, partial [Sphingorhabdus sp.]